MDGNIRKKNTKHKKSKKKEGWQLKEKEPAESLKRTGKSDGSTDRSPVVF